MADEPKPESKTPAPAAPEQPSATSTSPAPTEVAGDAKAGEAKAEGGSSTPPAPDPNSKVQAEPLSDGTTPTVLATGASHRTVPKSKASLTTVYRKADILTTVLTFAGAVVAGVVIIGGYAYFSRDKNTPTATPKVTTLDQADLEKLGAFFEGNSAGSSSQVLTINPSTLLKGRVAIGSDLKVTGNADVSGSTTLSSLAVDKTSNLGITSIRGQLTVSGPTSIQSPATFTAGASITGSLAVSGNGSYGGSVSAGTLNTKDLSVSGTLNLNGHLNVGGQNASAVAASSGISSVTVNGTDAAGTVDFIVGASGGAPLGAALVQVNFKSAYPRAPTIVITPNNRQSALIEPYIQKSATYFIIMASSVPASPNAQTYSFDYWVVQ